MVNAYKVTLIKKAILQLLDDQQRPISVREIGQRMGESYALINLSLSRLLHEGTIQIETSRGQNFVSSASSVSGQHSAGHALDESLAVAG